MVHPAVLLLLLFLHIPVLAQIRHLASTEDGTVYFSSRLRLRGTSQNLFPKIFVASPQGVRLVAERERVVFSGGPSWPVTTYYALEGVSVSGDGRVLAVGARRDCLGGSGCLPVVKWETQVSRDGAFLASLAGRVSLSRNGRYALVCCDGTLASRTVLHDLETGEQRVLHPLSVTFLPGRRMVSSTGHILLERASDSEGSRRELVLFGLASERVIHTTTAERFSNCVLDDAARLAACEGFPFDQAGRRRLVLLNLETGTERVITGQDGDPQPAFTPDGRLLLYLDREGDTQHIRAFDTQSGLTRQITGEPGSIEEFVPAGNTQAYAATGSASLVRIRLPDGTSEQVIGRTVSLDRSIGPVTPFYPVAGSLYRLRGQGFVDPSSPESEAQNLRVLVDGRPVPVLAVRRNEVMFQVPWDTVAGERSVSVETNADPTFETDAVTLPFHAAYPQFERPEAGSGPSGQSGVSPLPVAVHEDWDGLVTLARPARVGEVIHLYLTGLGPVEGSISDGEPAPVNRLLRTRAQVNCVFLPNRQARTLFAGLAPGLVGVYQVSIEVPRSMGLTPGNQAVLRCDVGLEVPAAVAIVPVTQGEQ